MSDTMPQSYPSKPDKNSCEAESETGFCFRKMLKAYIAALNATNNNPQGWCVAESAAPCPDCVRQQRGES